MTSRGDVNQDVVVRFAPSPNGLLHLGHAYAAMMAHDYARKRGGRFLLRIEDIDTGRSRKDFAEAILDDLKWLGLDWDGEVVFQSERLGSYAQAAQRLKELGLLYPCFCSRASIREQLSDDPPMMGPDGPVYPGTCRNLDPAEQARRMESEPHSWRLDVAKAMALAGSLIWRDEYLGSQAANPAIFGDVILVPKHEPVSYHLAVTVDDAGDGITHVVRGQDLFASTHVHRLLQALLDLPMPTYVHHRLLIDESGSKLSKSRESASLAVLRKSGAEGQSLLQDLRAGIFPVGISLSEA